MIDQLRTRGKIERRWLGARIQDLTPELAQVLGLPKVEGGLVADLTVNGPAARAGFARGDVILWVNGRNVSNRRDLLLALAALPIGQRVEVDVWREGAETALWPMIGEMPTENSEPAATGRRPSQTQTKNFNIGLNLVLLTKVRRELLEIPPSVRGVLVPPSFVLSGVDPDFHHGTNVVLHGVSASGKTGILTANSGKNGRPNRRKTRDWRLNRARAAESD